MKYLGAVIQARTGSTRLPNKVLREIAGKPLLQHMLERVRAGKTLDRAIVATTTRTEDDPIQALCEKLKVPYTRGEEEDVLGRYYQAAVEHNLGHIVRLTADCPLLDPGVIDLVVRRYLELQPNIDYVSNIMTHTFPNGMEVEIMGFDCLARAHKEAKRKYQREHVTPYIRENLGRFRCKNVAHSEDLSHHRWTVDREEDLELVRRIIEALYPHKKLFLMEDILAHLKEHPELVALNNHIARNEGFARSLERENMPEEEKKRVARAILKKSV